MKAGIGSQTISTIFLTHLHPYHTLGLADLLANDVQSSDLASLHNINIYGPPEHLDIRDVGQMASKAHVKSVLLYHWDPADPAAYVTGVSKYFSGPVFAGADLQRYCLGAATAAGQSTARPRAHLCE